MLIVQHSSSMRRETQFVRKMFDFHRWERLRECVGHHFVGRAINEPNFPIFNDPTNKMETNVDVFGMGMVLMLLRERNRGLIVGKQCGRCYDFKRFRQSSTVVGSKVRGQMSLEECKS